MSNSSYSIPSFSHRLAAEHGALVGRVALRQEQTEHPPRPEGAHGERRDARRVDAARDGDDDATSLEVVEDDVAQAIGELSGFRLQIQLQHLGRKALGHS